MAGEVNLQSILNRSSFQALSTPQKMYVLIHVLPTGEGAQVQMPLNLALALDHSGSMAGEKIRNLREAVKLVLQRLSPQDLVAIILFDDQVDTLVRLQPPANLPQLLAQVDQITDRGGTAISKGLRRSLDELRGSLAPDRVSRIVLLTDGETYGDEDQCVQYAQEAGQMGVPVSALGLGQDWNQPLLENIAALSSGAADYLERPDSIMAEFQRTVRAMQGTVVRNALLTLRLIPGISPSTAWRVLPDIARLDARALSDRDVQIQLGDLERGKGQSVLIELVVQPKTAGNYRIAQADVAYDVPAAGLANQHARQDIMLQLTPETAAPGALNPDVMNLVEKALVFRLQTQALDAAKAGNVALATQQLRTAATRLLNMGETDLAQAYQQEAANLEQGQAVSDAGTKKLTYGTRKLTQRLDDLDS